MSEATLLAERAGDTPHSAYSVLERRATLLTVGNARDMESMVQGIAQAGRGMSFDMSAPVFLAMWTAMMVGMMFPTIAPIVLLHRLVVRRRGEGAGPTVAFGAGYLVVWTAIGVVPLLVLIAFRDVADGSAWVDRAGGAVLVLAGLYQFTRWKDACQKACRTPMTFMMTHDFGTGAVGAFRTGVSHGLYCIGCCWALMAVLFVVGLMNLVWMAAIAVVFLAEKNWRHGARLSKVVGAAVAAFGVAVLIDPSLLGSFPPVPSDGMSTMSG